MEDSLEQATAAGRLNYFNYFTEVEEEFVRRRGKAMFVSPMDWALIESWKNAGIPLHIVFRGINRFFDNYDARKRRFRSVSSIFFCQEDVEASFAEYRLAQVGGDGTSDSVPTAAGTGQATDAFSKPVLLDFLSRSNRELLAAQEVAEQKGHVDLAASVSRACARLHEISREIEGAPRPDAEAIERDLDAIDRLLLESTRAQAGDDGVANLRSEAESQMKSYRKKMDKALYEQTIENFVTRRLREVNGLPRLSLFYI